MIEKAVARFNIDIKESYMIGDSVRDVQASEKIGVKGIKVDANKNLFDELSKSDCAFLVRD